MKKKNSKRQVRKKKLEKKGDGESFVSLNISGGAKRTIAAVFFVIFAIIFTLGFFEKAGMIGAFLTGVVGKSFGFVGKFLAPFVCSFIAYILVRKKKMSFYITKIVGIIVVFISILGLLHIPITLDNFKEEAFLGNGGGFIGYLVANTLVIFSGKIVAIVILLGLIIIGGIIAFDMSFVGISDMVSNVKISRKKKKVNKIEYEEKKENIIEEVTVSGLGDDAENELGTEEFDDVILNEDDEFNNFKEKEKDEELEKNSDNKQEVSVNLKSSNNFKKWKLPSPDLLDAGIFKPRGGDVEQKARIIEETFADFNIDMKLDSIVTGPTVTQFSFSPQSGVKLSKIVTLSADLALALAAHPIRIEAPIPGKSLIGIEVPNKKASMVRLRSLLDSKKFKKSNKKLPLALGKDVNGVDIIQDLSKMPHLLVAGATGAGKSVAINSIILSLLYKNSPEDLKMILVDPKRVELSLYNGIPHLLSNVITDNSKVINALKWAVVEMERRYTLLEKVGTRDLESYNKKRQEGETYLEIDEGVEKELENLPIIVIVIDEMADLMGTNSKEVEGVIVRLAQMSRAIGIHLILSTQRPSVEVITGTIKANLPTRIALRVTTGIDSRTIIDRTGAEKLVGNGDMLFVGPAQQSPHRLQGVYVGEDEVKRVIDYIKKQAIEMGVYDIDKNFNEKNSDIKSNENGVISVDFNSINSEISDDFGDNSDLDPLFDKAKNTVIEAGKASTSYLQRRLRIGYSRAARLVDELEEQGIVGPAEGSKGRKILTGIADDVQDKSPIEEQVERDKW